MALQGNLPTYPTVKLCIKLPGLPPFVPADALIGFDGQAVAVGAATFAGPTLSEGVGGQTVSVAFAGVTQCRLNAGLANVAAGTALSSAGSGRLKVAVAGERIVGRLIDAIGATPTVADQLGRFLISREGLL